MTKADIIVDIHEKLANRYFKRYCTKGYSKGEIAEIVESVFTIIKETLQREGRVMILEFGIFATKNKRARRGRNPRTGDSMEISPRRVLTFKPSPVLNASVNRPPEEIVRP